MASAKALLGAVAGRFIFRHGAISQVTRLSEHFARIDVAGAELANAPFVAGDKVQVFFPDVGMRTYTPVTWDAAGNTWFIGFVHDQQGPGSRWVRDARPGDAMALFGPRRSVNVSAVPGPLLVVGDETSLGIAVALTRARTTPVHVVLESHVPDETRSVAVALGLADPTVVPRGKFAPLKEAVHTLLDRGVSPVFTGRAATIQALKQSRPGVGGTTKAYWADGKHGLD